MPTDEARPCGCPAVGPDSRRAWLSPRRGRPTTADPTIVPPGQRALVSRGANLVVAAGVVVGTWSVRHDALAVSYFEDAGRPSADALDEGIARLGASLARPLDVVAIT